MRRKINVFMLVKANASKFKLVLDFLSMFLENGIVKVLPTLSEKLTFLKNKTCMCYPVFSVSWFFTCLLKIFRSLMKWPQISHLNRGIKRLKNLQPEREKLSYLNLSSGRLVWIFIFSSRLFLRLEVFEHTLTNFFIHIFMRTLDMMF